VRSGVYLPLAIMVDEVGGAPVPELCRAMVGARRGQRVRLSEPELGGSRFVLDATALRCLDQISQERATIGR
jgi:hypothetical protein